MSENLISGTFGGIGTIFEGIMNRYTSLYRKDLLLSEEIEKVKDGYVLNYLDNGVYLISPEIKERLDLSGPFKNVLIAALSETISILDKEIGKGKYITEVNIESDYEFPKWTYTTISIKVLVKDSKYIIKIWKIIEKGVREKIKVIDTNIEDINKIGHNLNISFEILE